MTEITGQCLCGAVRYRADVASLDAHACHCGKCRRWTGGPALCLEHDGAISFEGSEHIKVYPSSEWAERAFCAVCGSALYWRLQGTSYYSLSAGTIDDQSHLRFARQIFIDDKPSYYDFANATEMLTGEQVVAAFNADNPTE
jgi:hypothetical protein